MHRRQRQDLSRFVRHYQTARTHASHFACADEEERAVFTVLVQLEALSLQGRLANIDTARLAPGPSALVSAARRWCAAVVAAEDPVDAVRDAVDVETYLRDRAVQRLLARSR